jgi:hypothetical protein
MKHELKRVHVKWASCTEISSGLQEEECKVKEGKETSQLIKDHMLDVAQQVKAYFAELNVTYADLIKKMMAINEAQVESLKYFSEN